MTFFSFDDIRGAAGELSRSALDLVEKDAAGRKRPKACGQFTMRNHPRQTPEPRGRRAGA